jgi:hypothetical protein
MWWSVTALPKFDGVVGNLPYGPWRYRSRATATSIVSMRVECVVTPRFEISDA